PAAMIRYGGSAMIRYRGWKSGSLKVTSQKTRIGTAQRERTSGQRPAILDSGFWILDLPRPGPKIPNAESKIQNKAISAIAAAPPASQGGPARLTAKVTKMVDR